MARPNSGAIDQAIIGALQADATLQALIPDGVYFNLAQPGKKRFGLVGIFDALDVGMFGQRDYEETLYFVKAVGLSTVTTLSNMKAAAHRIDELLELAQLTPPDYVWVDCVREERLADTVPDPIDASLFWFHFGGHYRVKCAWP